MSRCGVVDNLGSQTDRRGDLCHCQWAGPPNQPMPDLELRHRRRARAEDRIRAAKDTGLTNLPLHDFAQNQIWCAIVALA